MPSASQAGIDFHHGLLGFRPFPAIIRPTSSRPLLLSFWNLIEARVLRALREDHGFSVKALRQAVDAEKGVRPLFH